MYKTVRQGENSLQYTILPQTEEVLTNSGVKGKGRDYSPSCHSRRLNRKLVGYYFAIALFGMLLMSGTVVSALVFFGMLPLDIASRIGALRRDQPMALKNVLPHATTVVKPNENAIKKLDMASIETTTMSSKSNKSSTTAEIINQNTLNSTTITLAGDDLKIAISTSTPITTSSATESAALKSTPSPIGSTLKSIDKLSSPPVARQRESNVDLMTDRDQKDWTDYEDDEDDEDYEIGKSSTQSTMTTVKPTKALPNPPKPPTTAIYASVDNSKQSTEEKVSVKKSKADSSGARVREMKERLLDDDDEDDDEEYKEPLTDEDDVPEQASDDVKMSQAKSSWLQTRWPFVDPSSYFQWTGYSARDNLLLPAILSAALSALLVLAILCYAIRRKQRCKRRIQEIGNLTSDLQAEDNAVLLTAENPSEED